MATIFKACKQCSEVKPLDEYHLQNTMRDGRQSICRPCSNKVAAAYRRKNPDIGILASRRSKIKAAHGITLEQFDEMLEAQGNCCALCKTTKPSGRGRYHVDHCHKAGKIRGILCHNCNTALGLFKDSTKTLATAIEYLNRVTS